MSKRKLVKVYPKVDAKEAGAAVLGFANVVAGLLNFVGDLADGKAAPTAAKRAVKYGKRRARALEAVAMAEKFDSDDIDEYNRRHPWGDEEGS